MPIYRATSQNPTTNIANQPTGNLAASLFDSMYQTIWNVLNDSSNGYATLATDIGTINNYIVINNSPALSYRQGMLQAFLTANANTGPAQINVDGLGNVSITTGAGIALGGGELSATLVNVLIYDGTKFRILLPPVPSAVFASSLMPLIAGWATYTGSLAVTATAANVTNWTQTGIAGLAITLDSATTNFTVPGVSIVQLYATTPADVNTYVVTLIGSAGTTIGRSWNGTNPQGVSAPISLAGFQTKGTFSVQANTVPGSQGGSGTGTLAFALGILSVLL